MTWTSWKADRVDYERALGRIERMEGRLREVEAQRDALQGQMDGLEDLRKVAYEDAERAEAQRDALREALRDIVLWCEVRRWTVGEMNTPIQKMLDPSKGCRRFTKDIAMHWYPPLSVPGNSCYCGETTMKDAAEDG